MDRAMLADRARLALALVVGIGLLGLTYALFDPDLGTPVPLFQEFTCLPHGPLSLAATDPGGRAALRAPTMALKMTARGDDELRPAYFRVFTREGDGAWKDYFSVAIPAGEHLMFLDPITNETSVRVEAKDLEGRYCGAVSPILRVAPTSSPPPS